MAMTLNTEAARSILDQTKFADRDMVAAIVVEHGSGEPLMFAFMNREALEKTLTTGKMHYWSRSRGKLWLKGESSGHIQEVRDIRIDCDADAFVFSVEQTGGACHTGYRSCFYRRVGESGLEDAGVRKVFDPEEVY